MSSTLVDYESVGYSNTLSLTQGTVGTFSCDVRSDWAKAADSQSGRKSMFEHSYRVHGETTLMQAIKDIVSQSIIAYNGSLKTPGY